ncbi:sugar O-acetyltransferase [soil metagenome]
MTEKEKMISGQLYDSSDKQLSDERYFARDLIQKLMDSKADDEASRTKLIKQLIPESSDDLKLVTPFYCDYGYNISIGEKVFLNFNCIILDVMQVSIGSRTQIGPNVQIYSATHPMDAKIRADGLESGKPVNIGSDVWIGGSTVICPGVTIGNRSVIGAGSIVTRDIPEGVFAAGNPCRTIKKIG